MNTTKVISLVARALAAIIMLQTLFFKFSGAEESIYIFSTLGIEPWGRIGIGIGELIASILLWMPALSWLGAMIGCGLMAGAIMAHLTMLGIEVKNDGGYLFVLALLVMGACLLQLYFERKKIPLLNKFF